MCSPSIPVVNSAVGIGEQYGERQIVIKCEQIEIDVVDIGHSNTNIAL